MQVCCTIGIGLKSEPDSEIKESMVIRRCSSPSEIRKTIQKKKKKRGWEARRLFPPQKQARRKRRTHGMTSICKLNCSNMVADIHSTNYSIELPPFPQLITNWWSLTILCLRSGVLPPPDETHGFREHREEHVCPPQSGTRLPAA